jgi:hypothetical protein
MSYTEMLSIRINAHNIDMQKVAYGTPNNDNYNELLAILAQVKAEPHYKDVFICKAMSVPKAPILPKVEIERAVIIDCIKSYLKKRRHQRARDYFIIAKDLKKYELEALARVALYSQIENTKKTEKYYYDWLGCGRTAFKKYRNTLELFCKTIDDKLHNIEVQAQKLRFK